MRALSLLVTILFSFVFLIQWQVDKAYCSPNDGSLQYIEYQLTKSRGDVEEIVSTGAVLCTSPIDLGQDGDGALTQVALNFPGLNISTFSLISSANLTFTALGSSNDTIEGGSILTNFSICGEFVDNSLSFICATPYPSYQITSRTSRTSFIVWSNVQQWNNKHKYTTPNLASVVQAIVNIPTWRPGNAITFFIKGYGRRVAHSFNSNTELAPMLSVLFSLPPPTGIPNRPATDLSPASSIQYQNFERPTLSIKVTLILVTLLAMFSVLGTAFLLWQILTWKKNLST